MSFSRQRKLQVEGRISTAQLNVARESLVDEMLQALRQPEIKDQFHTNWRDYVIEVFRIKDRRSSFTIRERGYDMGTRPVQFDEGYLHDARSRLLYHWTETLLQAGPDASKGLFFIDRISRDVLLPREVNTPNTAITSPADSCVIS
jgi:hypothetical protein